MTMNKRQKKKFIKKYEHKTYPTRFYNNKANICLKHLALRQAWLDAHPYIYIPPIILNFVTEYDNIETLLYYRKWGIVRKRDTVLTVANYYRAKNPYTLLLEEKDRSHKNEVRKHMLYLKVKGATS